jgi:hypothetical protein
MKTIRTVFSDNHSGESAWEGEMATFQIPDQMFADIMANGKTVTFNGYFVDAVWDDELEMLDDRGACDSVISCWVSTEPDDEELAGYPWRDINVRDDVTFDPVTWTISDQSGNTSPVYHTEASS